MKEHNDDIQLKHLLQDKLEEHTVVAPDFVWPAIEKELFPPANKRRPFYWWFVFTGLILGVLTFYFLYQRNEFNFNLNTGEFAALEKTTASDTNTIKTFNSDLETTQTIDGTSSKPLTNNRNNIHSSSQKGTGNTRNFQNSSEFSKTQNLRTKKTKKSKNNIQAVTLLSASETETKNAQGKEIEDGTIASQDNSGELKSNESNLPNSIDNFSNIEMSFLIAKTLEHSATSIPLQKTNLRFPRRFVPYSFIDFYAGRGRNSRNYSGEIDINTIG